MEANCTKLTERILQLTLEIIYLLTGEDKIVAKKSSGDDQNFVMVPLKSILIPQRNKDQQILEVTKKMMELLTGEVPIRCQDVTVYFSMEEWEYVEGHKELYKDVTVTSEPALRSLDGYSNGNPPERCFQPLYSWDSAKEDLPIPHNHQGEVFEIKTENEEEEIYVGQNQLSMMEADMMATQIKEESTLDGSAGSEWSRVRAMEMNCAKLTERILQLTLEIIYLLTGEDKIVAKKSSGDGQNVMVSRKSLLIPQRNKEQKILVLTKKMMELLTGEVPIRCQDVTVYFSMEEWEYLEAHKDLYKDVMMANQPTITLPEQHNIRNISEGRPILSSNYTKGFETARYSQGVSIVTQNYFNDMERSSDGFNSPELKDKTDTVTPNVQPSFQCKNRPPDPCTLEESSPCNDLVVTKRIYTKKNPKPCSCPQSEKTFIKNVVLIKHQRVHAGEKPFSCSECGKGFSYKHSCDNHMRIHTGERPFSCSECGKSFTSKASHDSHLRIHTGEKPFSCSECGKSFTSKASHDSHLRIHTCVKPFSCSECGKSFSRKAYCDNHMRIHTGEKPFSCSECGKSFASKVSHDSHLKIHTCVKPFSCSECGKLFTNKEQRDNHIRAHTGEKPFSCSECGKSFASKVKLAKHVRIHTGEKPFSCSECGKCFSQKEKRDNHLRTHTGEKPFSCSECGKGFSNKYNRDNHIRLHTGEKPFSCSECGDCFAYKVMLILHQRTHTTQGL